MNKYLAVIFLLSYSLNLSAQPETSNKVEQPADQVYSFVDEMPYSTYSWQDFVRRNILYPADAFNDSIAGSVAVKIIVRKDSTIAIHEIASSSGDARLDNEAIRVIKEMPKWVPGKHKGIPVDVFYVLPITFIPEYIHRFVDVMPSFTYDIQKEIKKRLVCPPAAKKARVEDRINVQFIVRKDGTLDNARAIGNKINKELANEAVRVISLLPKWKPGMQNGEPVDVYYTIPVCFN